MLDIVLDLINKAERIAILKQLELTTEKGTIEPPCNLFVKLTANIKCLAASLVEEKIYESWVIEWFFDVEAKTVRNWRRALTTHGHFYSSTDGGRPKAFSDRVSIKAHFLVDYFKDNNNSLKKIEVMDIMESLVAEENHQNSGMIDASFSRKTFERWLEEYGFSEFSGQLHSPSRVYEQSDIRNFVVFASVVQVLSETVNSNLICNTDSTTVKICPTATGNDWKMVATKVNNEVPTLESTSSLDFFIRFWNCHCAAGFSCPLVFILADSSLPQEAVEIIPVMGLTTGSDPNLGYIVFCKRRNGNTALCSWFYNKIFIPWINALRTSLALHAANVCIIIFNFYYIRVRHYMLLCHWMGNQLSSTLYYKKQL